jgi:hypothetical protein
MTAQLSKGRRNIPSSAEASPLYTLLSGNAQIEIKELLKTLRISVLR